MEYPRYTNKYKHYSWNGFKRNNPDIDSNYPFKDETVKQPKQLDLWHIYCHKTHLTIGTFKSREKAYKATKLLGGYVEQYHPTPEQRDKELADNRTLRRLNY